MTTNYISKTRSDKTVRIDTPQGHRIWVTRDQESGHILVHTSVRLAGHMMLVDEVNELRYLTVTRVTNHEVGEAGGALSTIDCLPLSDNALQMLVADLPELYETEFHEQLLQDMEKGGAR